MEPQSGMGMSCPFPAGDSMDDSLPASKAEMVHQADLLCFGVVSGCHVFPSPNLPLACGPFVPDIVD